MTGCTSPDLYDRKGHPITFEQWGALLTEDYKRVGLGKYEGGVMVSTVWLGIDHAYGGGKPLIFETMVFGPEGYKYQDACMRYATEAQAIMGHRRTCHNVEHGEPLWFEEEEERVG